MASKRKKTAKAKKKAKKKVRKRAGLVAPFKERVNRNSIETLADRFLGSGIGKPFDRESFVRRATRGLGNLELKDRVRQVAAELRLHLDDDYELALQQIVGSLGAGNPTTEDLVGGFIDWPLLQLVEDHAADPGNSDRRPLRRFDGSVARADPAILG